MIKLFKTMAKLFVLSGPSCAGKSPLCGAVERLYPQIYEEFERMILYTSRPPRAGETDGRDYFFRSNDFIESLRSNSDIVVMTVRGDLQALNTRDLISKKGKLLYEGNPFIGKKLLDLDGAVGVFLSPLSGDEVELFRGMKEKIGMKDLITEVMRRKLLRRAEKQKGILSLEALEEVERRALSAYAEMREAYLFDYIIPNHDGEDSENWDAFYYPLGDARRSMLSLVDVLEGREPRFFERWERDLIG